MSKGKGYDRRKYTLPTRWQVDDRDLFWQKRYLFKDADESLYEKLGDWLANWRVNYETIGFDRTVEDLPRIKGSALVVDHQFTGNIEPHLETLREYKGCLLVTDRTLWKVLPYKVPDIVANLDSSYLCISFFDRADVRKYMNEIKGVFASTTHPLTVRAFHGKRFWFQPWIGEPITTTLSVKGKLPVMGTGGNVATYLWILAVNLDAEKIGLLGIDNCFEDIEQTEYPGVKHDKLIYNPWNNKKLEKPVYIDPVYYLYADIHHRLIRYAKEKHGVETVNCLPSGVMHSKWIKDMEFKDFIKES